MSYDLYFHPRGLMPSRAEILGWLNSRREVSISPSQATYESPDSGVSFRFDFYGEGALPSFNINYARPHVFGLEAAEVLAAFVAAFKLEVEDPQSEGMGRGLFTREGFLKGWNHGNASAHALLRTLDGPPRPSLPAETIEAMWHWNRCRAAHQDWSGTLEMRWCFVPPVGLYARPEDPQRVLTGVVWEEAMAVTLPAVDVAIVLNEGGGEPHLIELTEIQDLLSPYAVTPGTEGFTLDGESWTFGLDHHILDFEDPPDGLMEALLSRGRSAALQRLSPGQVLTRELLDGVTAPT